MLTDELVKTKITDQLYWDHRIDASEVKIVVEEGRVTLSGSVPTYTAKEAASDDAWLVDGVTWVDNQLSVKYAPALTPPADTEIAQNVRGKLRWNPNFAAHKIEVEVENGLVTLEGTVDAYWKKIQLEREAQSVLGVIDVVNKVAVVPTEEYADERIAQDIVDAMDRNRRVNSENVNVSVEEGQVVLTGTVPTWTAKNAAFDSAFYTPGVRDVDDQVTMLP
jgi:osmotically-inducible protein OsmY